MSAGRRKRARFERRRPEGLRDRAGGDGEKGKPGTAGFPPVATVLNPRANGVLYSTGEEGVGEKERLG